ncbi:hypothetical protein BDZ89DRAFT_1159476 [Hymenopellis radicata]|nr:hypothetical protein BDZ89DRAFT_1159476 [Hymenopellis radicata]
MSKIANVQLRFPFPDLPVDIARNILETAAIISWRDASRLVLVSKAVRAWIDPILYHTILIYFADGCATFANTIRSRNDPSFFARHVKRLCVHDDIYNAQDLRCLLDVLTGLHCLAWWCDTNNLLPYINTSLASTRYLSMMTELDSPLTVETLLPRNITHLNVKFDELDVPFGNGLTAVWTSVFARCPFLTHVMVDFYPDSPPGWATDKEQFVRSALSVAPPTLKAFIIEFQNVTRPSMSWRASEFGPFLTDSRFIIVSPDPCHSGLEGVVCYPIQHDPLLDWQYLDATSSDLDIWEFVDTYRLRTRAQI